MDRGRVGGADAGNGGAREPVVHSYDANARVRDALRDTLSRRARGGPRQIPAGITRRFDAVEKRQGGVHLSSDIVRLDNGVRRLQVREQPCAAAARSCYASRAREQLVGIAAFMRTGTTSERRFKRTAGGFVQLKFRKGVWLRWMKAVDHDIKVALALQKCNALGARRSLCVSVRLCVIQVEQAAAEADEQSRAVSAARLRLARAGTNLVPRVVVAAVRRCLGVTQSGLSWAR